MSNLNPAQAIPEASGQPSEEILFNVVHEAQLVVLDKPPRWYMQSAAMKFTARQAREWRYPSPETVPDLAKFAHRTLAERYMSLAGDVARVSMGLRPAYDLQEMVYPDDHDLLASLSQMRSPWAMLADRTQAAGVALLESIWTYSLTNRRYKREPFLFPWYAVRRMHATLREHAATEEHPAFTPDVVEDYYAMHEGETNAAFTGPARQTELNRLHGLVDVVNLDELVGDQEPAGAQEDAPFDAVHFQEFLERLGAWFGEPHASYFKQAYGLEGGGPAKHGEIAEDLHIAKSYVYELGRRCDLLLKIFRPVVRKAWFEGAPLPPENTLYLRDDPES